MKNQNLHSLLISKATLMWLFLVLFYLSSFSQTTNIAGTVNTYHAVIQVIPAKACVRVSSTTGLGPGNKILLLQMKGAAINTTNALGYGNVTALNDAGNYEFGIICTVRGDSVFLVHSILNTYTTTGKVQLVKFGEYVNANVTGTLSASAWNNATGTGGVLAIFVEQNLTLNANIIADSRGFGGGAPFQSNSSCSNSNSAYFYNGSPVFGYQRAGYKGESITDLPNTQSGGMGAPANGGGGGNDHNNSGGGGSNLTAGGIGGGNSGTSSCNAAWISEGGKALSSAGGTKVFLGGGGGAGHKNYVGSFSQGASGGGIVFIHAANVIGNGFQISASGGYGGNSASDGAGGGGGGGTIIMDAANYTGAVLILAEGGHGGDSEDGGNINLCFGGGGGGSGGAIYFSGASPAVTISTNAGGAGVETGRDVSCLPTPRSATAGTNGQIIQNYTFRRSIAVASYCSQILPVRLNFFKANALEKKVTLQWQLSNPETVDIFTIERMDKNYQWTTLTSVTANDRQQDYFIEDIYPLIGYNSYRLKITEKTNANSYSSVRRVFIGDEKGIFTVYPNPAIDKIVIKGIYTGPAEIRLSDVSGKNIFHRTISLNNSTEVTLPRIAPGIYMLHINNSVGETGDPLIFYSRNKKRLFPEPPKVTVPFYNVLFIVLIAPIFHHSLHCLHTPTCHSIFL